MNCNVSRPPTLFWDHNDENGWLSNFYPATVVHEGRSYPTSEHLYQSLKFDDPAIRERIRLAATPRKAKLMAKRYATGSFSKEILQKRVDIMRLAIRAKFDQHPALRRKLLALPGLIIESSKLDSIWGWGPDRRGLNLMGLLLMELRAHYLSTLPK